MCLRTTSEDQTSPKLNLRMYSMPTHPCTICVRTFKDKTQSPATSHNTTHPN